MRARATLLGHSIHQMLIVVPLGLYVIAVVFDVITVFRPIPELTIASFWNIVAGSIGAVVAAVFGVIDWTKIPPGTRARRIGVLHAGANVILLALFVIVALLRYDNPGYAVSSQALVLELVAFAFAGMGGWLGGELIDRLGIGVDEGAHPDATSSLRGAPLIGIGTTQKKEVPHGATPTTAH